MVRPSNSSRWFYPLASSLLLVLTVAGFRLFYFGFRAYPGHELPPPIRGLLIAHALTMSLWMLLAVVQPWLVAAGKRKLHMRLGMIGAVLALGVLVTGVVTTIESVKITPPELVRFTFPPKPFLMVPLSAITLYALYVGLGIWQRKHPAVHRPLMLLGSLAAVSAATARITVVNGWVAGTVLEQWLSAFVFPCGLALVLWLAKCALDRKVDRPFGIAAAALVVWFAMCTQVARTDAWLRIADVLLGSG